MGTWCRPVLESYLSASGPHFRKCTNPEGLSLTEGLRTTSANLYGVTGASIVVIGLTGGSLGSHHGETVQMYVVAIMIELKSALHYLVPGLLFNLPNHDYCSPLYNV